MDCHATKWMPFKQVTEKFGAKQKHESLMGLKLA
jgi:hypothetical protein